MPKSRKKKVKHQDFAKVKLKVGKKLPRAANETNSSFQSRSIQLKEQFKGEGSSSQTSTNRKLSLSELLSHCQHYSSSVKHDALVGLRELLTKDRALIHRNLSTILSRCAELFVDKDGVVRSTVNRLFRVILPNVSANQISPFFPVLSAHICCAMTHIYEDIQADSLVTLDLFLDNYPELVVATSSQLLPNFLEQISRSSGSSKKSRDERTLTVNPSGKLGSQKWRLRVLERLRKLLQAIVDVTSRAGHRHEQPSVQQVVWKTGQGHRPMIATLNTPGFVLRPANMTRSDQVDERTDAQTIKTFMKTIVPLLLECWVEVGPSQLSSAQSGNALNSDALTTLRSVVNVLILLLQYCECCSDEDNSVDSWIKDQYHKEFARYFMVHFPYDVHEQLHRKGQKNKPESNPVTVHSLNLAVCQLMAYFMDQSGPNSQNEAWFETVSDYITEQLRECKQSSEQLKTSLLIVQKVLQMKPAPATEDAILKAVYHVCKTKHPLSPDLRLLLEFFMDNFLSNSTPIQRTEIFSVWVGSLPRMLKCVLNQEATVDMVLRAMKLAAVQRNQCFLSKLQGSIPQILDPSLLTKLSTRHQRAVVEVLYNLPEWSRDNLGQVSKVVLSDVLSVDVQLYLLETLGHRILRSSSPPVDLADYISVLFTVGFGETEAQLRASTGNDTQSKKSGFKLSVRDNFVDCLRIQYARTECIIQQLSFLIDDDSEDRLGKVWQDFVTNVLNEHKSIHLCTALAVLKISTSLSPKSTVNEDYLGVIALLVVDAMATSDVSMVTELLSGDRELMSKAVDACCQDCLTKLSGLLRVLFQILEREISKGSDLCWVMRLTLRCIGSSPSASEDITTATLARNLLDIIHTKDPTLEASEPFCALQYAINLYAIIQQ